MRFKINGQWKNDFKHDGILFFAQKIEIIRNEANNKGKQSLPTLFQKETRKCIQNLRNFVFLFFYFIGKFFEFPMK